MDEGILLDRYFGTLEQTLETIRMTSSQHWEQIMGLDSKDLEVVPERAQQAIAGLDAGVADDRAIVLNAVIHLVSTHIAPNMGLALRHEDGEHYFDLNVAAGREVSGLVLELRFNPRFPDLQKPSDAVLKEAIDAVHIDLPDAVARDGFFRCWEAEMAIMSAELLLGFLRSAVPPSSETVNAEIDSLEVLLDHPLPGGLKFWIADTILMLSKDRAVSLRARTTDPFIVESLA